MLDWVGRLFGVAEKGVEIADKAVIDKDALIKLAQEGRDSELQAYVAELSIRTIPWVDALHKMGRQIHVYLIIGLGFYSTATGKPLDPVAWGVLGGAAGIYGLMKGKGQ